MVRNDAIYLQTKPKVCNCSRDVEMSFSPKSAAAEKPEILYFQIAYQYFNTYNVKNSYFDTHAKVLFE